MVNPGGGGNAGSGFKQSVHWVRTKDHFLVVQSGVPTRTVDDSNDVGVEIQEVHIVERRHLEQVVIQVIRSHSRLHFLGIRSSECREVAKNGIHLRHIGGS